MLAKLIYTNVSDNSLDPCIEEGLFFIPPQLVKDAVEAAASTAARDEWIKQKMDTRKYKSSDLYGTPRDPELRKEMDEYIKTHQPPKKQ